MHLKKRDLLQMNDEWLRKLPPEVLFEVSKRLLSDVKELQDRLNQNSDNSSRPPSSQAPWQRSSSESKQAVSAECEVIDAEDASKEEQKEEKKATENKPNPSLSGKPPGRQKGSPGHGRTQKLAITATCEHRPEYCTVCGRALMAGAWSQAYSAWDEVDIAAQIEGVIGLTFSVTRHLLHDVSCSCCHITRAEPWRALPDAQYPTVEVGEWRLVGPRLAGVIVLLALRMRLSRARIRELLMELFDLTLSIGVIDETIREAGQACLPLEDALVAEIVQAA